MSDPPSNERAIEAEVVVLGAGPAGATAALNLAPFRRVLVIERRSGPPARTGESLPASARRLLTDMGLWEGFLADTPLPNRRRLSFWGGPEPAEIDALRDPDGSGWHIDRTRFDARLRATATERGAALLCPAEPRAIVRRDGGWCLDVAHAGRLLPVRARMVIDARGRAARPLPAFAARRQVEDRLICGWMEAPTHEPGIAASPAVTEAETEGWWYSALLPQGRRLLAFYTDADLPAACALRSAEAILARARNRRGLASPVQGLILDASARSGVCAAHGARLDGFSGPGWIAVGDAACALDPLSSQGVFNALYTGLSAAEAAERALSGDPQGLACYDRQLNAVWQAYRHHRSALYDLEGLCGDALFWVRRRTDARGAVGVKGFRQARKSRLEHFRPGLSRTGGVHAEALG